MDGKRDGRRVPNRGERNQLTSSPDANGEEHERCNHDGCSRDLVHEEAGGQE